MTFPNIYDDAHAAMLYLKSLIQLALKRDSPAPGTKELVQTIIKTIWTVGNQLSTLIHPLESPSPPGSELESVLAAEQPESIRTPPKECRRITESDRLKTWLASVEDKKSTPRRRHQHAIQRSTARNSRIEKHTRSEEGYRTRSKTKQMQVLKTQR